MKKIGFLMAATALVAAGSAHAESHEGRATDGHLNIIYWQAPSLLNP